MDNAKLSGDLASKSLPKVSNLNIPVDNGKYQAKVRVEFVKLKENNVDTLRRSVSICPPTSARARGTRWSSTSTAVPTPSR